MTKTMANLTDRVLDALVSEKPRRSSAPRRRVVTPSVPPKRTSSSSNVRDLLDEMTRGGISKPR
jgi:hypothetical protein